MQNRPASEGGPYETEKAKQRFLVAAGCKYNPDQRLDTTKPPLQKTYDR
jgi:hypothetical protein